MAGDKRFWTVPDLTTSLDLARHIMKVNRIAVFQKLDEVSVAHRYSSAVEIATEKEDFDVALQGDRE